MNCKTAMVFDNASRATDCEPWYLMRNVNYQQNFTSDTKVCSLPLGIHNIEIMNKVAAKEITACPNSCESIRYLNYIMELRVCSIMTSFKKTLPEGIQLGSFPKESLTGIPTIYGSVQLVSKI